MKAFVYFTNFLLWSFFILSSIALFVGALVIWLLTLPFDPNKKILQAYSCFWASLYLWVNPYWDVKVGGRGHYDRSKTYIMVSNHKSLMDILIVFRTFFHFKWVSKASLFRAPLLGWNMYLNGYVPIQRGDAQSREVCMDQCKAWVKKGSSVFFFPEGTRSKNGDIGNFKIGAFRLAIETGTDILPMMILGSEYAVPKHSILLNKKSKMEIRVLPPFSVRDYDPARLPEEAARLAEDVRQVIKTALDSELHFSPIPAPAQPGEGILSNLQAKHADLLNPDFPQIAVDRNQEVHL